MNSRRRVTAALVGLLVLVAVGWLIQHLSEPSSADDHSLRPPSVVVSAGPHG